MQQTPPTPSKTDGRHLMLIKYTADTRRAVYLLEEFVGTQKKNKSPFNWGYHQWFQRCPPRYLTRNQMRLVSLLPPLVSPFTRATSLVSSTVDTCGRSSTRAAGPRLLPSPGTGVLTTVRCWDSFECLSLHLKRIKLPIWPTTINLWLPIW
jgi:hypothetical protein